MPDIFAKSNFCGTSRKQGTGLWTKSREADCQSAIQPIANRRYTAVKQENLITWLQLMVLAGLLSCGAAPLLAGANAGSITAVKHIPEQPRSGEIVKISAKLLPGATNVLLQYQLVEPGKYIDLKDPAYKTSWSDLPMRAEGDGIYAVEMPANLQKHRRLVRYRIQARNPRGETISAPASDDLEPNFAYFVYDGIPGWSGAINAKSANAKESQAIQFSAGVMRSVQAYHLISKATSVENATWRERSGGKEYKYTGTFVSDGKVYDHVRFRARGGVWRYAMGKNMWKFDFNKGHDFQARNDYGEPYRVKWSKLNLRACIQQGDYGHRGEQGMFEAVGFRLFTLAGVPAPHTHWVQLRIVDEVQENPASQYRGDFWGLYLAIENEDGRFLAGHGLPSGNLYKMEGGTGSLSSHGTGAVTNNSDLNRFLSAYNNRNPSNQWWQANLDLPRYYSYRSILECIHHYDVEEGKNYDYYLNPETKRWIVIPWDIDLTWANNMYGSGNEPFESRVLSRPAFKLEYRNRLREIRDLLFNADQGGQLIDECAGMISGSGGGPAMVDADRAKWDYHPVMAMGGKAGQGRFYEATPSHDFAGMVRLMKSYVKTRGTWVDRQLLNDPRIPSTPLINYTGDAQFPSNQLSFHCSEFAGSSEFAAMKWRVGEIAGPERTTSMSRKSVPYEISSLWESEELKSFEAELKLPPQVVQTGHTYRVRARMKDKTGRWSHWSAPIEFTVGGRKP